ncbi:hypothetical protein V2H45_07780 [Tumidithrix elongata RA019]|uniref:Uncharacterized protein n=1 Tax=Tumidithrix elongata BACA0141 TaxID=2716417 RepID=A0AAW9Q071_9CYAN|nr:hypothetical protein [Tumidithrix elongata RA019]
MTSKLKLAFLKLLNRLEVNFIKTSQKSVAIESTPSSTPVDASNTIPAIVNSPTVGAILAFAVLVRVILDRPSSGKQ